METSPFLAIPAADWLASNELAFAISDRFPFSRGHALVIPKQMVATWFQATVEEQRALMALTHEVKALLESRLDPPPDGWNIGINVGAAAGHTTQWLQGTSWEVNHGRVIVRTQRRQEHVDVDGLGCCGCPCVDHVE